MPTVNGGLPAQHKLMVTPQKKSCSFFNRTLELCHVSNFIISTLDRQKKMLGTEVGHMSVTDKDELNCRSCIKRSSVHHYSEAGDKLKQCETI